MPALAASRRRLLRGFALAALGAVPAAGVVLAPSSIAATPKLRVLATGLDNPRKIFVASDGAVYVAEAGTGGNKEVGIKNDKCQASCVGFTGSVMKLDSGKKSLVVTGLVSLSNPLKVEAQGVSDAMMQGGKYYVLMQDMNINDQGVNQLGPQLALAGDLLVTRGGKAKPKVLANLAVYEAKHNPDHGIGPGAKYGEPPIDSDPYAFVPYRGGFAVADAAANDLLWVSPKGKIGLLAVFPVQKEKLTAKESKELNAPKLHSLPVQSVPTSVTVGPDGALYVGELTGWPFQQGKARIWRVIPGQGKKLYASGFTNISDLAFDGNNLLVLEIDEAGLLHTSSPGALIRITPNGKRTVIARSGLVEPTGLAVGDGNIYISNHGIYPGTGHGPHGELVTLPASLGD